MKKAKYLSLFFVMIMMVVAVVPASAQDLGDSDSSAFMVQNTSGAQVTVTIQFVNSTGGIVQPTCLDGSGPCTFPNPFNLATAASREIVVGSVPLAQLPAGKYSVIISSTGKVVAVATVSSAGTNQFTGGYSSFDTGASTVYLSTVNYNWTTTVWYSMVTVMNLGDVAIPTVTFTIKCTNPGFVGVTGTLTKTNLAAKASHTWVLKPPNTVPTGFTGATTCQGGGTITSSNGQPLAVVNNNNQPFLGKTATFESLISGSSKVYLPQVNSMFTQWISAINILKQGAGPTTVTVTWGDGDPPDTCSLTDAVPSCQMVAHTVRSQNVRTSAVVTSSNGMTLLISVGSSRILPGPGHSAGYNGFSSGSPAVALPYVTRNYAGWVTAINCMNVSTTSTKFNIAYEGRTPYDTTLSYSEGQSFQIFTPSDGALPDGWLGSAVITAVAPGAQIACQVGNANTVNAQLLLGDWSEQYIGLPK
jgi:hypothetical protein